MHYRGAVAEALDPCPVRSSGVAAMLGGGWAPGCIAILARFVVAPSRSEKSWIRWTKSSRCANAAGFIFPSSEIYGGPQRLLGLRPARRRAQAQRQSRRGGPTWSRAARRDRRAARRADRRTGWSGLDCSLLMNPRVWEASGHVGGFSDPMVDDRETRRVIAPINWLCFASEFVAADGAVEGPTRRRAVRVSRRGRQDGATTSCSSRIASGSRRLAKVARWANAYASRIVPSALLRRSSSREDAAHRARRRRAR